MEKITDLSIDSQRGIGMRLDPVSMLKLCQTNSKLKKNICNTDITWINQIKKTNNVDINKLKSNYIENFKRSCSIIIQFEDLIKNFNESNNLLIDRPQSINRYYIERGKEMPNTKIHERGLILIKMRLLIEKYLSNWIGNNDFFVHLGKDVVLENKPAETFLIIYSKENQNNRFSVGIENDEFYVGLYGLGDNMALFKIATFISEEIKIKGLFLQLLEKIQTDLKVLTSNLVELDQEYNI